MILDTDGGHDAGAVDRREEHLGDYLYTEEKDINLNISLLLGIELKKYKGVKVVYTRTTDRFITLTERADFANRNKADIFVSIHNNAASPSAKGFQVYYCTGSKNGKKLALAILKSAKAAGIKIWDRPIPRRFAVLTRTIMPAVLVECGFITNIEEEKLLNDKDYQLKLAQAISLGIVNYIGINEPYIIHDPVKPKSVPKPVKGSVLKWGDKGNEIKTLQNLLNNLGFNCGTADGIFGRHTFCALVLFQSLRKLSPTGITDAPTSAALSTKGKYSAIKKGDKGQGVKVVQELLTRHYRRCAADGDFGRITEIQVKRFQRDNGLIIDGLVGINTVGKLLKY